MGEIWCSLDSQCPAVSKGVSVSYLFGFEYLSVSWCIRTSDVLSKSKPCLLVLLVGSVAPGRINCAQKSIVTLLLYGYDTSAINCLTIYFPIKFYHETFVVI